MIVKKARRINRVPGPAVLCWDATKVTNNLKSKLKSDLVDVPQTFGIGVLPHTT